MEEVRYRPVGVVHSPFSQPEGTPIQPEAGRDVEGTVEVFPEFSPGLKDVEGFSHLILLFHCHLVGDVSLEVVPHADRVPRGVFATRAPARPNPIGLSVVRLDRVEGRTLHVRDLDVVDGTPLLDIKPFFPTLDAAQDVRLGWLEGRQQALREGRDDGCFAGA